VVTTATDAHGLPSFDMLAKEMDWGIEDLSRVKILNSLLLKDTQIAVVDPTGLVKPYFSGRGRLSFFYDLQGAEASKAEGILLVTNRETPEQSRHPGLLVLRPRNLVLGIGCNRGTGAEEIEKVVESNMGKLSLSMKSIRCIATAMAKRDEEGLLEFADKFSFPLTCFESGKLNSVRTPSPPSQYAMDAIGATGVAEPAAILASQGGRVLLNKVKSGNVTLAIAEMEKS
jgi:cobalt-precorrin 5A hydrolase